MSNNLNITIQLFVLLAWIILLGFSFRYKLKYLSLPTMILLPVVSILFCVSNATLFTVVPFVIDWYSVTYYLSQILAAVLYAVILNHKERKTDSLKKSEVTINVFKKIADYSPRLICVIEYGTNILTYSNITFKNKLPYKEGDMIDKYAEKKFIDIYNANNKKTFEAGGEMLFFNELISETETIDVQKFFAKMDEKDSIIIISKDTETDKYLDPTFSFVELKALKKLELVKDSYLDNARDWLLISCYTGQRVSDLLKMNSEGIIEEEFYIVHQQKGQKDITIWLMPDVISILNKREGNFPRKISAVKYNDYIKKVGANAEITQIIKGAKQIKNRKVTGRYHKNELITSHIGRRTFVSLFKHFIGSQNVQGMTGHTTEAMVNLYDKSEALEIAKRVKRSFEGLNFDNEIV